MKQNTVEALYKDFLNMKESGELFGMTIKEDEFGEKFMHVPNDVWYYLDDDQRDSFDSIVEEEFLRRFTPLVLPRYSLIGDR